MRDFVLLRIVYYAILRYWPCIQSIYTFLNKVDPTAKNVIYMAKNPSRLYYYVHSLASNYLACDRKITLMHVINKIVFILHESFISFTFEYIYLKYHKYLQSGQKVEPRISNNMWSHVFRYKVGSFLPCFLVTQLDYIYFLLYMAIFHLLRI